MSTITYGNMTVTVEQVTPALAAEWLSKNTTNRKIRPNVVSKYQRDMETGKWHKKPLAICFDSDGNLGNGQHTLMAVLASGKEQELLVARHCTRDQISALDSGLKRTISDIAHFVGVDISPKKSALTRAVAFGADDCQPRSFEEVWEAYQDHKDAVDFVISHWKGKGFSVPVFAAVGKAYYHAPAAKLERFLTIFKTGVCDGPHESGAIRIRDFVLSSGSSAGSARRKELFDKAQTALQAFLDGAEVSRLHPSSRDIFPLPEKKVA